MRDPEGVVHVDVVAVDQLLDEGGVVVLLAGVEAKVLEQFDLRSQKGELLAHRCELPADIGSTFGPTEMRAGSHRRPAVEQVLQRRERRTDAEVVGDSVCPPSPSRSGTLKSTRTSTLAPSSPGRSPSRGKPLSKGLSTPLRTATTPSASPRPAHRPVPAPITSDRSTSRLA